MGMMVVSVVTANSSDPSPVCLCSPAKPSARMLYHQHWRQFCATSLHGHQTSLYLEQIHQISQSEQRVLKEMNQCITLHSHYHSSFWDFARTENHYFCHYIDELYPGLSTKPGSCVTHAKYWVSKRRILWHFLIIHSSPRIIYYLIQILPDS